MHDPGPIRCLILTCGNPLRSDDGVGPWLASWAQEHFGADPSVRIMYRQQWTPELADHISRAAAAIFIDASTNAPPGAVQLNRVTPGDDAAGLATHHMQAQQLLALAGQLYESTPITSLLLTIGIGSSALGDTFSEPVRASLEEACGLLEKLVDNPHDAALCSNPHIS
jgi:hydrogenase maturation protease